MASSGLVKPMFFCNHCLEELKMLDEAPSTRRRGDHVYKRYLTQCSHVLCQNCRVKGNNKCIECNQPTKFLEICENMPKQYQLYFENIGVAQIQLENVMKFQQNQHDLIAEKMIIEQEHLEQKCAEAMAACKIAEVEWQQQEIENRKTKIIFDQIADEKRRSELEKREEEQRKQIDGDKVWKRGRRMSRNDRSYN